MSLSEQDTLSSASNSFLSVITTYIGSCSKWQEECGFFSNFKEKIPNLRNKNMIIILNAVRICIFAFQMLKCAFLIEM